MRDKRTLIAACDNCGHTRAFSGPPDRILDSYQAWDERHAHRTSQHLSTGHPDQAAAPQR